MKGGIFVSDIEVIAQSITELVSNTEKSITQMRTCSQQVNQMVAMVNHLLKSTQQQGYQDILSNFIAAKDRLDYASMCLNEVSKAGNDWVKRHVGGNTTSSPMRGINTNTISNSTSTTNGFGDDVLKPTRNTPRNLQTTQFGFSKTPNGLEIYDSPMEMDQYLYAKQGSADKAFQGTCGLCSCANILRLAGVNLGEKEVIDYASKTKTSSGLFGRKLCVVNPFNADESGGTNVKDRQKILEHYGVKSTIWGVKTDKSRRASQDTINDIGRWVSEGRGVIVDVDAGYFYNSPKHYNLGHAVTITSVERNRYGDITAFYILDSNRGTVKYNAWELQEALRPYGGINVTDQIIR